MTYIIRYDVAPSRKDIRQAIARALARKQAEERIMKIRSVLCPEHRKPARVSIVKGALQVAVCCRELEAAIRKALK